VHLDTERCKKRRQLNDVRLKVFGAELHVFSHKRDMKKYTYT